MTPAVQHRKLGYALIGLAVLLVAGLVAGYIWSIINGEAAVVTAATAILVFAAGEFFTRRRVAQQYRWDKVANVYESFIRVLGEMTDAKEGTRKWTEAQAHALKPEFRSSWAFRG